MRTYGTISRLREVKNKRKYQTIISKSGRSWSPTRGGRLRAVPSIVIWLGKFWYFGKVVAQERWLQGEVWLYLPWSKAMSTPIPDNSSCSGTKNISDSAFVQTQKADFGSIFVPEPCYAALVLKVIRRILDRFSILVTSSWVVWTENRTETEDNTEEQGLDSRGKIAVVRGQKHFRPYHPDVV